MLRFQINPAAIRIMVCVCALAIVLGSSAQAQVIQTGPGVYQSTPETTDKFIATPEGFYFESLEKGESLQTWDPRESDAQTSKTVFIHFNPKLNSFDKLYAGGKEFAIRGNFAINIGRWQVKADNYSNTGNFSAAYLTVVVGDAKGRWVVIPFKGTTQLGTYQGKLAVSVLEAGQVTRDLGDTISPYEVSAGSKLLLNGQPVTRDYIGLAIPQGHSHCLEDAILIDSLLLKRIRSVSDRKDQANQLKLALDRAQEKKPLEHAILLSTSKDKAFLFDTSTGEILQLDAVFARDGKQICEVSRMKL